MKNKIKEYYKNIQDDFFLNYKNKVNHYKFHHNTMTNDELQVLRDEIYELEKIKKEKYLLNDYINIPGVYSKYSLYNKVFNILKLVNNGMSFEEAINQ